jgi:hypothetical protein
MVLGLPRRPKREADRIAVIRHFFRFPLGNPHVLLQLLRHAEPSGTFRRVFVLLLSIAFAAVFCYNGAKAKLF